MGESEEENKSPEEVQREVDERIDELQREGKEMEDRLDEAGSDATDVEVPDPEDASTTPGGDDAAPV
jgi:hypothetical protein